MEKNTRIQKGSVKEAPPLWVYECRASVPEFIGLKNHQNLLRIWTKNEKNHQILSKNEKSSKSTQNKQLSRRVWNKF